MRRTRTWVVAFALLLADWPAMASDLARAFQGASPILDARLRYESVDQQPFLDEARAVTLRTRFGVRTAAAWHTSLLLEGTATVPLDDRYNSTTNRRSAFPVVADPENYALNRLQLVNTTLPGTTVTLGRQRLNLDDQRFVGSVGWRQTEQTFDALRVVGKPGEFTFDLTYANQVNRVFGRDGEPGANAGRFHGDNWLLNVAWQNPLGKLTAFGYLVDLRDTPQPVRDSTRTLGLRLAGARSAGGVSLAYVVSYAAQRDYARNPLSFDNDYWLAELTGSRGAFSLGAGMEWLQGDGVKGFSAPLGTLHKFQGWADKFLTTPANGLRGRLRERRLSEESGRCFRRVGRRARVAPLRIAAPVDRLRRRTRRAAAGDALARDRDAQVCRLSRFSRDAHRRARYP